MEDVKKVISKKKQKRLNRKATTDRTEEFVQRFENGNLTNGRPYEKVISSTTFKKFWSKRVFKTSTSSRNGSCGSRNSLITTRSSKLSSGIEDEAKTDSDFFTSESDSVGGIDADIEDFKEYRCNRPKLQSLIECYIRRKSERDASLLNYPSFDLDNEDVFEDGIHGCNIHLNTQLSPDNINSQHQTLMCTSASSGTSEKSTPLRALDYSKEDVSHKDPICDNSSQRTSNYGQSTYRNRSQSITISEPDSNCEFDFNDGYSSKEVKVDHFEYTILDSFDEGTKGDVEDCLDSDFSSSPIFKPYYRINCYF